MADEKNNLKSYSSSTVSLVIRIVTSVCGLALLVWGFYIPPQGTIDRSVLIAFGEIAVFVSALMWIDYHYHYKTKNTKHK